MHLLRPTKRRGAASLDYVLTMGIVFPMALFIFWIAPRIMNLVYEMLTVFTSWPFGRVETML